MENYKITIDSILESIDQKILKLSDRGISPKVIILGDVPFYTLISHIQNNIENPLFKVDMSLSTNNTVNSIFYYKDIPIFYDKSLNAPTPSMSISVFGE